MDKLAEFSVECGNAEKVIERTIEKAEAFDWIEKRYNEIEILGYESDDPDKLEWRIELDKNAVMYSYTGDSLMEAIRKAMKGEK